MRNLWVDSGNDPQYEKAARYGIRGFFFDMFDERITKHYLQQVSAKGFAVGVFMAWNWPQYAGKTGAQMAEITSEQIGPLRVSNSIPKVQFNIEEHNPLLISSCLERWRQLRRFQDTSWTLEGMQGGWMEPNFVQAVVATKTRVVPQAYTGDMTPFAEDIVLRDLTRRGFPEAIVSLFYDAKNLPLSWDGFAFTQGRLP